MVRYSLLSCLILLGCGPAGSEKPREGVHYEVDSAGVTLSVTVGWDALELDRWSVDSIPNLVLGAGDSPAEYFYHVQGVKGLQNGGILVVDGGSREIRWYDASGRIQGRVGGQGEGPTEFEDPFLVPWIGTDSLLLFDSDLSRFQVLGKGGQYSRTFRTLRGWPAGRVPPLAAVDNLLLLERTRFVGEEPQGTTHGLTQLERSYIWFDPSSERSIEVDRIVIDWGFETKAGTSDIPFSPRPAACAGREGAYITDGRDFQIRHYDLRGKLRSIYRIDAAKRAVTPEMIDKRIDAMVVAYPRVGREAMVRDYAEVPVPDSLPSFSSLFVDELGFLWAQEFQWDHAQPKDWIVFDTKGKVVAKVSTPAGFGVGWIGENRILGVRLDGMNVEFVHQYRLQR